MEVSTFWNYYLNPSFVGPVYIRYPNFVIIVLPDVQARPWSYTVLTSASVVVVTFRWPDDAIQNDGAHLEFRCSSNQKNDKIQKKKHKNDKK